jgi:hypothetical protein
MPRKTEAPEAPSLENFQGELARLVEQFGRNLSQYKSGAYDEAGLRAEFLTPFLQRLTIWTLKPLFVLDS